MLLHITQAHYLGDYKLQVSFNNGHSGIADLSHVVQRGVFQQLQALENFSQVRVDTELATITWPNGLDLAPEFVFFCAFSDKPEYQEQFKSWGYLEH